MDKIILLCIAALNLTVCIPAARGNVPVREEDVSAQCGQGDVHSCFLLGTFEEHKGYFWNIWRARKLYKQACEKGEVKGCIWLGRLEKKQGNSREALEWMTIACEKKDTYTCGELGDIYKEKGDLKQAKKFYILACSVDDDYRRMAGRCKQLGDMERKEGNLVEAMNWYKWACTQRQACKELREALAEIENRPGWGSDCDKAGALPRLFPAATAEPQCGSAAVRRRQR